jgi:hypothetical protein
VTVPAALHSAKSVDWGTSRATVEMFRHVLGGSIDVDPCSSAAFNRVVRAGEYYTRRASSLNPDLYWKPGRHTSMVNPPGGHELVKAFWAWSVARWQSGWAIGWVGFSLEQLVYLGRAGVMRREFVRCIPPSRLRYLPVQRGRRAEAPPHGSYLLLMPNCAEQRRRFHAAARELGAGAF